MKILTHRLILGEYEALIAPGAGACLLSFTAMGKNVLRLASSPEACRRDPREAACFPCVPYFGRLYDGLTVNGKTFEVGPTLAICDAKSPLHGEGWITPWEVVDGHEKRLLCRLNYQPVREGAFPFSFAAMQAFALTDDGLTITLRVTNTDTTAFPAGLAIHPFFERHPETRVAFSAASFWSPPDTSLAIPDEIGAGTPAPLPPKTRDHSYAWPDQNPDRKNGLREAHIIQRGFTVRIAFDAPALHLYAPESEPYFCLEPITHLPGLLLAENRPLNGRLIAPGEGLSTTAQIGLITP